MVTVQLHKVVFSANHGYFEEEQFSGNRFEADLDVSYDPERRGSSGKPGFEHLESIVDYVELFGIMSRRMQMRSALMEKICEGIIADIRELYPFVREISISIFKLQAPIARFQGRAGVKMTKRFD